MEKLEFRRQVFHLGFGLVLVALIHFGFIEPIWLFYLLGAGVLFSLLSLRYRLPFISWCLNTFDRKSALPGLGALTFLVGCILALLLFPMGIALASILVLTVGDSVSVLVGQSFGRTRSPWNARFLEGTFAAVLLSSLAASLFVPFWIAFIASAASLILEALELKIMGRRLDDNIWLPVVAGAVISILI